LIGAVVAAISTLDAQQASPTQATATQQTPKPGIRALARTGVHPIPTPSASSNPARDKKTNTDAGNTNTGNRRDNYAEAMRRYRHERHDQVWWKRHYVVIVLVGGGYYYWDSGYWYPAWGYDPNYERYDYDGPIYTYGNLLPDQVVINVQHALKEFGYYEGAVNGSLGANTRRALIAYQVDNDLDATGAVDEATVRALGLI